MNHLNFNLNLYLNHSSLLVELSRGCCKDSLSLYFQFPSHHQSNPNYLNLNIRFPIHVFKYFSEFKSFLSLIFIDLKLFKSMIFSSRVLKTVLDLSYHFVYQFLQGMLLLLLDLLHSEELVYHYQRNHKYHG